MTAREILKRLIEADKESKRVYLSIHLYFSIYHKEWTGIKIVVSS